VEGVGQVGGTCPGGDEERTGSAFLGQALTLLELAEEVPGRAGHGVSDQAIDDILPFSSVAYQIGFLEDRKVPRDGRLREIEIVDDLAHGVLAILEEPEDLPPCLVREGFESESEVSRGKARAVATWRAARRLLGVEEKGFRCFMPPH
jgi:hypothetical protein